LQKKPKRKLSLLAKRHMHKAVQEWSGSSQTGQTLQPAHTAMQMQRGGGITVSKAVLTQGGGSVSK
jgi:hypothetical protein